MTNLYEKNERKDVEIMEEPDYKFISNININQSKSEIGFKTLVDGFDSLLYVIPKYQRKFIWSQDQVQSLAISLLRGLPIPPIYVYRNENGQLEILDGQQRMVSLFLYYKGKYFKNKTKNYMNLESIMTDLRLNDDDVSFETLLEEQKLLKSVVYELEYFDENMNKQILNINYDNLKKDMRRRLDFTPISIIEIKVDSESYKHRILYTVFQNLNRGGTQLKNQEVRNGAYQSEFYDMLHDINNNNLKWREIYGPKHIHSRDVELLLRFCSVEYYFKLINNEIKINNYNGSYPSLLNDFSDEAVKFDSNKILEYRNNLETFINRVETGGKIPTLLLESLYLANIYVKGNYKITQEFCQSILNDKDYSDIIDKSPSIKIKVKERFDYVYKRLFNYVEYGSQQNIK